MPQPHAVMDSDYTCQRCRMVVQAFIPHECNPDICITCSGTTNVWGVQDGFAGFIRCPSCDGTGRTNWDDTAPEGVPV